MEEAVEDVRMNGDMTHIGVSLNVIREDVKEGGTKAITTDQNCKVFPLISGIIRRRIITFMFMFSISRSQI